MFHTFHKFSFNFNTSPDQDNQSKPTCTICNREFAYAQGLKNHMALVHEGNALERKFKCQKCPEEFNHINSLRQHKMDVHGQSYPTCTICGRTFAIEANLKKHVTEVHEHPVDKAKIVKCGKCPGEFKNLRQLRKHYNVAHDQKFPKTCLICGLQFAYVQNLKMHMALSHDYPVDNDKDADELVKTVKCRKCPGEFDNLKDLRQHYKEAHDGFKIDCNLCDTVVLTKFQLKKHKKLKHQRKVRVWFCQFCDNNFLDEQTLERHMKALHKV